MREKIFRILLAEDNPVHQIVTIGLLEKQGYQVELAVNGRQVLDLLHEHPFDLVLMDIQMPFMDGLEATRHIRKMEKLTEKHIAVIAMTAHTMKGVREMAVEAGMDAFISKPIKPSELFDAVKTVLNKDA